MWLVWLVVGLSVISLATGVLTVVLISSLRNGKGLRTGVAQRQVRFKVAAVMGMVNSHAFPMAKCRVHL
jgi:heme exporter protein D